MLYIRFRHDVETTEPISGARREMLMDLRADLPPIFMQVPDEVLVQAYEKWSDDTACAGWLIHDPESLRRGFLMDIVLVDSDGNEISPFDDE